jgi:hypothetical protein
MIENIKKFYMSCLASIALLLLMASDAYTFPIHVIEPSDDGSIYSNGSVITFAYLMSSSSIRGVVEFPLYSITVPIKEAVLSVNPYGLPLWDKTIALYGYESTDGILTFADYDAGVFLGIWTIPESLGFGEDTFFDVTDFLKTVTTSYVGFNLRTEGTDVLSSIEYNYGHPSQLTITLIPEPSTIFLLGTSLIGLVLVRRLKRG